MRSLGPEVTVAESLSVTENVTPYPIRCRTRAAKEKDQINLFHSAESRNSE